MVRRWHDAEGDRGEARLLSTFGEPAIGQAPRQAARANAGPVSYRVIFDFNDLKTAGKVLIIGNGGSYANAQHIANDLIAAGVCALTLDAASLTASANDCGYENVFSRWVHVAGEKSDLLVALSGSGTSRNILSAIEEAERIGMKVWRVFGADMGLDMQSAEEAQIKLGHEAMRWLKRQ